MPGYVQQEFEEYLKCGRLEHGFLRVRCDDVGATPQAGVRERSDRGPIETCPACGGAMRIIACIEDPDVIEKILTHLGGKVPEPKATRRPPCRAPPQRGLFDETG